MGWVSSAIAIRTACIVLCTSCTYCQARRGRSRRGPSSSRHRQRDERGGAAAKRGADRGSAARGWRAGAASAPTCRRALSTGGPGAANRAAHWLEWPSCRQLGSQADGRTAAIAAAAAAAPPQASPVRLLSTPTHVILHRERLWRPRSPADGCSRRGAVLSTWLVLLVSSAATKVTITVTATPFHAPCRIPWRRPTKPQPATGTTRAPPLSPRQARRSRAGQVAGARQGNQAAANLLFIVAERAGTPWRRAASRAPLLLEVPIESNSSLHSADCAG